MTASSSPAPPTHGQAASRPTNRHAAGLGAAFIAVLIIAFGVYSQGLPGFLILDDIQNLSRLDPTIDTVEKLKVYLVETVAGPLGRPLSMLAFLIDDNAWPVDPAAFKTTNIWLHLLAGTLVFALLRKLFSTRLPSNSADWLALAAASLWLVNPMQVSTALYIVQRMTLLASIFVLAGLVAHAYLRTHAAASRTWRPLAWPTAALLLFGVLATLSKESGALLVIYAAVLELTVYATHPASRPFLWWRRLCLYAPSLLILAFLLTPSVILPGYRSRDFGLGERLATEAVVLMDYLHAALTLTVHKLGLYQDDYPIYSWLSDWRPAVSAFVIIGLVCAAVALRRRSPLLAIGPLWFFGGHVLESSTYPLEVYFEHRNYLPLAGIAACAVYAIYGGLRKALNSGTSATAAGGLFFALSAAITSGYASEWRSPAALIPIWAAEHPQSLRAQIAFAQELARQGHHEAALIHLDDVYRDFPENLSIPLTAYHLACVHGRKPHHDLNLLIPRIGDHSISEGLVAAVSGIGQTILRTPCADQARIFHRFVRNLPAIQGGENARSSVATFFVTDGNLYLQQGNGNKALEAFETADILAPSPDSALRIANLYIRVGLYSKAIEALDLAESRAIRHANALQLAAIKRRYQSKREEIGALQAASGRPRD